jgi:AcrR family transcriptional regulator
MARTLNPVVHTLRRDQFVDAAQELIASKGYARLSIQDVLDATGTSRGALYHYFDSKASLLEAVIDRMTQAVLAAVAPEMDDPSLPAREKLQRLFAGIGAWKTERKDLMLGLMEVWYSDQNIVVRDKFRRESITRLEPVLARILAQGNVEGAFDVDQPGHTAEVFVSLIQGLNERAGLLYLARQAGTISFEEFEQTIAAYVTAFERILGIPRGSLKMIDEPTRRAWFA